ncbi:MAG TPA: hypothetical protein VFZ61_32430, partial [Polyangiales bacterium]
PAARRAPRRLAWGVGLAAAVALSLLAVPAWQRVEQVTAGPVATTAASLSLAGHESATLELLLQAGPLARGLVVQTSAAAVELVLGAQSAARALLELLQQQTAMWESQVRGHAIDRPLARPVQR